MRCPKCFGCKTRIINTKMGGSVVERVRRCMDCSFLMTTQESPIFTALMTKEEVQEYEEYVDKELIESQKQSK